MFRSFRIVRLIRTTAGYALETYRDITGYYDIAVLSIGMHVNNVQRGCETIVFFWSNVYLDDDDDDETVLG